MDIFGKCVINGISISDDDLNAVGIGLYVGLSALNHSCDPNAFISFDGPKALIRPLKSGLEGRPLDQITVSYCDLLATTKERQQQLQQQYYFLCDCSVCANKQRDGAMRSLRCPDCSGEALLDDSDESKHIAKCWQCGKVMLNIDDAVSLMQQILWRLTDLETNEDLGAALVEGDCLADSALARLSDVNIFAARLFDCLTELNLKASRTAQAATYCERALSAYIRFYPAAHPAVSLQLLKAAKLVSCAPERLEDAARRFQQAESALTASHGANHRLTEASRALGTHLQEERRAISHRRELSD
uniref:SET domain-containing protein n=1 Tax=Plectus sambesii TaxID=2011161 RepID=A0A914VIK4_9BILA